MSGLPGVLMSGPGISDPLVISLPAVATWAVPPSYGLGIVCTLSPGASLTYSVQVTCDPIPNSSGYWNNHDVLVALSTSKNDSISYPITGLRLNVTFYGGGSVNLGVAQWP